MDPAAISSCPSCQARVAPRARFCPACGAGLAGGASSPGGPPPALPPSGPDDVAPHAVPALPEPALALHFPHLRIAGYASTATIRVTNPAAAALDRVEVTLESRALAAPASLRFARLAPGQTTERMVELEPERAGDFVLQVCVSFEEAGLRRSFRGPLPFKVLKEPDSKIDIRIGDIQSNAGTGANAGLGAEYGDVSISNLLGGANIRSLNDLLEFRLPEKFTPVRLELDHELSCRALAVDADARRRPLRIPPALLGAVQPGTRCILRETGGAGRELRLVSRPQLRAGRARAEADLVTWFWPRDAAADERTLRVSKLHAVLQASPAAITIRDAGSANGTQCDGQPVGSSDAEAATLAHRSLLTFGGDFQLEAEIDEGGDAPPPAIANAASWAGPAGAPAGRRGSVRFTPRATGPGPCTTVWLFSAAAFGTSRANGIRLEEPALDEIQGRFHHHRGCFWLENSSGNRAVAVNGAPLAAGEIAPLSTGATVALGAASYRVEIEP